MAVYNKPGLNCATTRRRGKKAICASPELANFYGEISAVNRQGGTRDASDGPRAPAPCSVNRTILSPPQCRLRPAGTRSAQGNANGFINRWAIERLITRRNGRILLIVHLFLGLEFSRFFP